MHCNSFCLHVRVHVCVCVRVHVCVCVRVCVCVSDSRLLPAGHFLPSCVWCLPSLKLWFLQVSITCPCGWVLVQCSANQFWARQSKSVSCGVSDNMILVPLAKIQHYFLPLCFFYCLFSICVTSKLVVTCLNRCARDWQENLTQFKTSQLKMLDIQLKARDLDRISYEDEW